MKSWTVPNFIDKQYSLATPTTPYVNADNCVEQALCHAIWMITGKRYSPRALGQMVDVQPSGSEVNQAISVANARGLIPYDLWPTPETFTWESYYSDISKEILAKAEFLDIQLIPPDLEKSPVLTELEFNPTLPFPGPYHLVTQFSANQFFDSQVWNGDENMVRTIPFLGSKIIWQSSIRINKLPVNLSYIKRNQQFWQINPDGTKTVVTDEDVLKKLYFGGLNYKTIN